MDGGCHAPGAVDTSFGTDGIVTIFGLEHDRAAVATGIALDPSSRIVVSGGFTAGPRSCVLARLLPDGSRDISFGNNGIVRQSVGNSVCWYNQVALQEDGKIVAFGEIDAYVAHRSVVARYLADGTLDPTFGDGGMIVSDQTTSGLAVALDSSQRILVAGELIVNGQSSFQTRRYLPDGTPDPDFGLEGVAEPAFSESSSGAYDLAVEPDGKVVVVGGVGLHSASSTFAIVRYTADGTPDPSFGLAGLVRVVFETHSVASGVVRDYAGRFAVVGGSCEPSGGGACKQHNALSRLAEDGSLDISFGDGAGQAVDAALPGVSGVASTMQNELLVVGSTDTGAVVLARYTSAGSRDNGFGGSGIAHGLPLPWRQVGWDVAVQADGRVVVVGGYGDIDKFDMFVARYCP